MKRTVIMSYYPEPDSHIMDKVKANIEFLKDATKRSKTY